MKFMVLCDFDLNPPVLNEAHFESGNKRNSKGAGLLDLKIEIHCSCRLFGSQIAAFFWES